jgi:hypothetical protein
VRLQGPDRLLPAGMQDRGAALAAAHPGPTGGRRRQHRGLKAGVQPPDSGLSGQAEEAAPAGAGAGRKNSRCSANAGVSWSNQVASGS